MKNLRQGLCSGIHKTRCSDLGNVNTKIAKEKEEDKKRKQNTKKILLWGAQVKSVTKGESIAVRIIVGSFVERLYQNTLP